MVLPDEKLRDRMKTVLPDEICTAGQNLCWMKYCTAGKKDPAKRKRTAGKKRTSG